MSRRIAFVAFCFASSSSSFIDNSAVPQLRSKVMLTTRLTPRIVEAKGGGQLQGCRELELRQMQPEDAVAFFHTQGIRGKHTEIELACEHYGYHPLSLRLLAGLIIGDFQQPGDIAAAKRLDVSGDLSSGSIMCWSRPTTASRPRGKSCSAPSPASTGR